MKLYIKDTLQILVALLLTVSAAHAMAPTPHKTTPRIVLTVQTPKTVPPVQKPVLQAPVASQPVLTGCAQYNSLFEQYPWNVQVAEAICMAESAGNPGIISNANINYDGLPDYGLMQLHGIDIIDPAQNIAYAYYHKYLTQGWEAWSTYNSGAYLKFL